MTRTLRPCFPKVAAREQPSMPAPTMATSHVFSRDFFLLGAAESVMASIERANDVSRQTVLGKIELERL